MEKEVTPSTKSGKSAAPAGGIPAWLASIHFDNHPEWLAAYKKAPAPLVARAVMAAYRRRYFLSVDAAAKKLGVSKSAIMAWEAGKSRMQWNSKVHLVRSGQFHPEHLGGSGAGDEVGYFGDDA